MQIKIYIYTYIYICIDIIYIYIYIYIYICIYITLNPRPQSTTLKPYHARLLQGVARCGSATCDAPDSKPAALQGRMTFGNPFQGSGVVTLKLVLYYSQANS